jgi:hypothetical protein
MNESPAANTFCHPQFPACNKCKHFIVDPNSDVASCAAFPIIPREILTGEVDHTRPVRGDNGIRYEPVED